MSGHAHRNTAGPRRPRTLRGFGMAEAVICTALVGVMLVAALNTVGASATAQRTHAVRHRGKLLAEALLCEALQKAYQDPGTAPVFGREGGETSMNRTLFDDVDDYNNWTESPPIDEDGVAIPGFTGWERRVTVVWANTADVSKNASSETKIKRIAVTSLFNGQPVASAESILADVPHNPEDPNQ